MRIEVWSDIACPWCWLGKHHLEQAARRTGIEVQTEHRSFELQPERGPSEPALPALRKKLGPERLAAAHERLREAGERVGLHYDFDHAVIANTFDAHRVFQFAKTVSRGADVLERFMRAYHGEGEDLADHAVIHRLGVEAGLDPQDVRVVLSTDAHAVDVRSDEAASVALGVQGVPFFLIAEKYGLSGAQPVEVFERVLRQVRDDPGNPTA